MKKTSVEIQTLTPEAGKVLKHKTIENLYSEMIQQGTPINEDDWMEVPREEYDAFLKAEEEKAVAGMPPV